MKSPYDAVQSLADRAVFPKRSLDEKAAKRLEGVKKAKSAKARKERA